MQTGVFKFKTSIALLAVLFISACDSDSNESGDIDLSQYYFPESSREISYINPSCPEPEPSDVSITGLNETNFNNTGNVIITFGPVTDSESNFSAEIETQSAEPFIFAPSCSGYLKEEWVVKDNRFTETSAFFGKSFNTVYLVEKDVIKVFSDGLSADRSENTSSEFDRFVDVESVEVEVEENSHGRYETFYRGPFTNYSFDFGGDKLLKGENILIVATKATFFSYTETVEPNDPDEATLNTPEQTFVFLRFYAKGEGKKGSLVLDCPISIELSLESDFEELCHPVNQSFTPEFIH